MRERFLMILFVLILGSVLAGLLVAVNEYTSPLIEKNKEAKVKASILNALDIPFREDNLENVFSSNIDVIRKKEKVFYFSSDGKKAFEVSGAGLWGPIQAVIALEPDLETIAGITVIHQEETPGLGGRIAEEEYLRTFKNKKTLPNLFIVPPGKSEKHNEVDAITGATMTSKAFEKLINSNVKECVAVLRSEK